jgi:hypothetical protein
MPRAHRLRLNACKPPTLGSTTKVYAKLGLNIYRPENIFFVNDVKTIRGRRRKKSTENPAGFSLK